MLGLNSIYRNLCVVAAPGMAQTTSHLSGNYTFTGASAIQSVSAQTTVESPQPALPTPPFIVTDPAIIFPELDTQRSVDSSDGFSLLGRYDFLNGTGTSAKVTITANRPLVLTTGTLTESDLAGAFGIDSVDFTNLVTGATVTTPLGAHLDSFIVSTYLMSASNPTQAIATVNGASGSVPVAPNFPNGAFLSTGPLATGNASAVIADNYNLVQVVTMNFSSLVPGESVDILLPEPTHALGVVIRDDTFGSTVTPLSKTGNFCLTPPQFLVTYVTPWGLLLIFEGRCVFE